MRRDSRLTTITEALQKMGPHASAVRLWGRAPGATGEDGASGNVWAADVHDVARHVYTRLYGRPDTTPTASPLAQADDAKRRRDIAGEVGALVAAGDDLTSAPWYPVRPGDLVHVHYEAGGEVPAFGETYIVDAEDGGLMGMRLLANTLPDAPDEGEADWFAAKSSDDPIFELWFEAGPHRITIVRDGQVVHDGGHRGRGKAAARVLFEAERHAATMREVQRYLERGEPELALARLRSDKPLPPCGAPGVTPEQPDCPRPRGHRPPCSDDADYVTPPHECPALPEQLYAVLSVGPKRTTVSFEGLYADKDAALDIASGWDQHAEAERRVGHGVPDYVFIDLPAPGGSSLAVVAPMPVKPDPRAEEEWAAEGMATALGPEDYPDDYRDVDE
ncbi:hypothetical protein [Streptomyces sp. HYC2]|uniref:hypothetical protein n=1 Tax=Streptomyces sp. HYC2 TaxID=2955207 RepID=UPI002480AA8A|nr:hypothetical protein [Streptomyces sp. HYC2]